MEQKPKRPSHGGTLEWAEINLQWEWIQNQEELDGACREGMRGWFLLATQPFSRCSSTYSPVVTLQNCVEFIFGHILIWKCYDNGRDIEVKSIGCHNLGKYIISNL